MASQSASEAEASGLVHTLQGHVDDLRTMIQCGICIRPLYEPYSLACGHTFCYSCLTSWFAGGKTKRTCPDCRAPVKTQPAPAYLVRAMVHMFTSRAELLDKGETTKEHSRNSQQEADKVDSDKANNHPTRGGLFNGLFKPKAERPKPLIDVDDGVMRCPHCQWELEEGNSCAGCGYEYREGEEETDMDDSDLSSDSDPDSPSPDAEETNTGEVFHLDDFNHADWEGFGFAPDPVRLPSFRQAMDSALFGVAPQRLPNNPNHSFTNNAFVPNYPGQQRPNYPIGYGRPYSGISDEEEEDYDEDEEEMEDDDENEYDVEDSFIDDYSGVPSSSYRGGIDLTGGRNLITSEASEGTVMDGDHDDHESPNAEMQLQYRGQIPRFASDSEESEDDEEGAAQELDSDSNPDESEEEVQTAPPRRRQQPQAASRSHFFESRGGPRWISSARAPAVPDSEEGEESSEEVDSSPEVRPARPVRSSRPLGHNHVGASVGNAISLDDSDDEQPVGPVRRNTHRRQNRFSPY